MYSRMNIGRIIALSAVALLIAGGAYAQPGAPLGDTSSYLADRDHKKPPKHNKDWKGEKRGDHKNFERRDGRGRDHDYGRPDGRRDGQREMRGPDRRPGNDRPDLGRGDHRPDSGRPDMSRPDHRPDGGRPDHNGPGMGRPDRGPQGAPDRR